MLRWVWSGHNPLSWLLWPLSQLYKIGTYIKSFIYQHNFLNIEYVDVPVIVVGNITVGGTGKTPFCIALCAYLKQQGYRPGLVSRGYGGLSKRWPQVVTPESNPRLVGDEPVLLTERTGCPMVVDPDRVAAVKLLIKKYACDVVISDDGLQHYHMGRDIEIVIIDKARGLGNGLCLPAGPLRESKTRLRKVDFVVENGGPQMRVIEGKVYALNDPTRVLKLSGTVNKSVCAIAGIGNPQRFFDSLTHLGFEFEPKVFRDHYHFRRSDLQAIDADLILMTEKDAVKCRRFHDDRCYVLPIEADIDAELLSAIKANLKTRHETIITHQYF